MSPLTGVYTPCHSEGVSNQPKTPIRTVRIADDLWRAAQAAARRRGENVSDVIRRALETYIRGNR